MRQVESKGRAVQAAQAAPSFSAYYRALYGPRHMDFPRHLLPVELALADQRIEKLMLIVGPGGGKSSAISVAYPTYLLGMDPSLTILTVSGSEDLPRGFLQASMEIIEHSKHFHQFFPGVLPDKQAGWSTDRGIYVRGHAHGDPDASYYAAGLMSKAVVGKHARLIILDDVHTDENSQSPGACEKVIAKYYNTIIGRADPRGARFLLAGRRWSQWDIYGHLMEAGDWVTMRLPAERPGSQNLFWDVFVPPGLECCWTEGHGEKVDSSNPAYLQFRTYYGTDDLGQGFYWPQMPSKRAEYFVVKRSRPAEAAAVYQGQPGGREAGIFLSEDFERLASLGRAARMTPALLQLSGQRQPSGIIIQAWDTALEDTKDSDYSVCITALLTPCSDWHCGEEETLVGACDAHYDVLVVDALREKIPVSDLNRTVREMAQTWGPSYVGVERKASGIGIVQALSHMLPIVPIKADKLSKAARITQAVPGNVASVQGWVRMGRVRFWVEAPWLDWLRKECLDFSGDGSGHDDGVDALSHGIALAISLGSGRAMAPSAEVLAEAGPVPALDPGPRDSTRALLGFIGGLGEGGLDLPAPSLCLNCRHWTRDSGFCAVHRRRVAGMDVCEAWSGIPNG